MRYSLYLRIASVFVIADLKAEQKRWERSAARTAYHRLHESEHLLRDIGMDASGYVQNHQQVTARRAKQRVRLLHYLVRSRLAT